MFFLIKYAEDVGSGTSKIIQWCEEWGLPEPTYEEAGASFVTVFRKLKVRDFDNIKDAEKGRRKVCRKIVS